MIKLFVGENSFEIARAVEAVASDYSGETEYVHGEDVSLQQLPELLMGVSLFHPRRLVVIRSLSENKEIWPRVGEWIGRASSDSEFIFVEPKPDRRTKTFKELQKYAAVSNFPAWTYKDTSKAVQWVEREAKSRQIGLSTALAQFLVRRVGVDQWALQNALEQVRALPVLSEESLRDAIVPHPSESVFDLFQSALQKDVQKVHWLLRSLRATQEPHQLMGLLHGQAFQLAALHLSSQKSAPLVAKDIGVHPYALTQLASHARGLSAGQIRTIVRALREADFDSKHGTSDMWLLLDRAMSKIMYA